MNFFDDMINDILGQLNRIAEADTARLEQPSRLWKDAGEHHMILGKEMAYELGGQNALGLSGCLCTTKPLLLPRGVYLYGDDLTQIKTSQSFARIVLAELEESNDEEAMYRKFREMDYVRYHIHPEGYMVRISPVSQREPVRIGVKALKNKISFGDVGRMYLERYQRIPQVKNVNVIFVTHREFDYCALDEMLRRAEQITESLNHIFAGLNMDCGTCNLKAVCDEVEGLRDLHFGYRA
ncbi:MAG: carbon monoxide dehydrogenase [Acetatifactor sp.]|nr:carbon monoxide dehydrogenase [Acetatifactor sp.]